jgi:hypothetical protein
MIAYMTAPDYIQIVAFDAAGTVIDTYPASGYGDGYLISDLWRANALPDGKGGVIDRATDFCVAGYTASQSSSNACGNSNPVYGDVTSCASVLCGSMLGTQPAGLLNWDSVEYVMPLNGLYNISTTPNEENTIVHAVNMDSNALDEWAWIYGIVSPSLANNCEDGLVTKPLCYVNLSYAFTKQNGITVPVDTQKIGKNDFLIVQMSSISYLDDGFSNSPVADFCTDTTPSATLCSGYEFSPCNTMGAWAANSTVAISITPKDINSDLGDTVRARAILYYGTIYEQDSNWTNYYASGTPISFSMTANQISLSATLLLEITDDKNPSIAKTMSIPFSVAVSGISNGECTITHNTGGGAVNGTTGQTLLGGTALTPNQVDNPVYNGLKSINDASGNGLGIQTIWIIIAFVATLAIVLLGHEYYKGDGRVAMFVGGFTFVGFIILGALLGLLGVGLIILFVILAILVIGFWIRGWLTGSKTG